MNKNNYVKIACYFDDMTNSDFVVIYEVKKRYLELSKIQYIENNNDFIVNDKPYNFDFRYYSRTDPHLIQIIEEFNGILTLPKCKLWTIKKLLKGTKYYFDNECCGNIVTENDHEWLTAQHEPTKVAINTGNVLALSTEVRDKYRELTGMNFDVFNMTDRTNPIIIQIIEKLNDDCDNLLKPKWKIVCVEKNVHFCIIRKRFDSEFVCKKEELPWQTA